jgi:alpha-galactosidase
VIKVAMMGAGSAGFCRGLVEDILSFESMKDVHFALMDVVPEKLELMHQAFEHMKVQNDLKCTFSATIDRREALRDADFAISMIQVGGLDPYKIDIELPLSYGVDQCIGDTLNPGGIFRGLRHVPALLDMMETMKEVSKPDIVFMNYANPMAIVSWAMQKVYPEITSVGLCHGVQHTTRMIENYIGLDENEADVLTAGINHMAWFLRVEKDGEDLLPRMWEKLNADGGIKGEEYRFEMMKAAGYFMTESPGHLSEYLPFFRKRQDIMDLFGGPGFSGETGTYLSSCTRGYARYDKQIRAWAANEEPVAFDKDKKSVEYASNIMNAKIIDQPFRFAGNILNKGFITNLPYDSCVEVPTYSDRLGLHGTYVGRIPEQCAALCQSNISVQELTVKAAIEGDPEAVFHACLMDPLTSAVLAPHEIRNMVEEMIKAQMEWLPQFKNAKFDAPGWNVGRRDNGDMSERTSVAVDKQIGHYDND